MSNNADCPYCRDIPGQTLGTSKFFRCPTCFIVFTKMDIVRLAFKEISNETKIKNLLQGVEQ